jgi:uncharacterized protein YbbC (DUF1343 family)
MNMGMEIASVLRELYPDKFDAAKLMLLTGNAETVRELENGDGVQHIIDGWAKDLQAFGVMRSKYLMYK